MQIHPSDPVSYRWLITYLALLECTSSILQAFWCQVHMTVAWTKIHPLWNQCLSRGKVGQHPELTGGGHHVSRIAEKRLKRNYDSLYIEDSRWLFPVLQLRITAQRTVVYSISWKLEPLVEFPVSEHYGPELPLHEMSWEDELLAIFDSFTQNYIDSTTPPKFLDKK